MNDPEFSRILLHKLELRHANYMIYKGNMVPQVAPWAERLGGEPGYVLVYLLDCWHFHFRSLLSQSSMSNRLRTHHTTSRLPLINTGE